MYDATMQEFGEDFAEPGVQQGVEQATNQAADSTEGSANQEPAPLTPDQQSPPSSAVEQAPRSAEDEALYGKIYHSMQTDRPAALRLIFNDLREGQLTDYVRYERSRDAQARSLNLNQLQFNQLNNLAVRNQPLTNSLESINVTHRKKLPTLARFDAYDIWRTNTPT